MTYEELEALKRKVEFQRTQLPKQKTWFEKMAEIKKTAR